MVAAQSDTLTIDEMALRYGVTFSSLRFYEDRGLLSPLHAGETRFYTPSDEIRLQLIQKGKKLGLSLAEIGRLLPSPVLATDRDMSPPVDKLDADQIAKNLEQLESDRKRVVAALEEFYAKQSKFE